MTDFVTRTSTCGRSWYETIHVVALSFRVPFFCNAGRVHVPLMREIFSYCHMSSLTSEYPAFLQSSFLTSHKSNAAFMCFSRRSNTWYP